jgi:hypothetical protein
MSGSVLRLLQHSFRAGRLDQCGYLFCLMPYDDHGFLGAKRCRRAQDVLDQRAASGAVQHFRQPRLQPGTFSGGKDHDGQIMV